MALNTYFSQSSNADVFANRPTTANAGDMYFATDTGSIYRFNGTAWQAFSNISAGTFANLPSSPVAGQLYKFTDSPYSDAYYNGTTIP